MNQQSPIGAIIQFFLRNPELLIIGFVILSSVINFIGNSGKRLREAQAAAEETEERRRRGAMLETEQREANPSTQSYDGYLKRTEQPDATLSRPAPPPPNQQELKDLQADILEALGMGTQTTTPNANPQEELRRKLAEKMGRTTPQASSQMPLGRGKPPPPAPTGMKRPPPRMERKPIETTITSNIETYLDSSSQEKLERDSRPDSLGHSKSRPHFDVPQGLRPDQEGGSFFPGELGSTVVALRGIQEVRGKEIVPTNRPVLLNQKRFIDPKEAVSGFVWNEILSTPRSRMRR
jgi:type II secretory pathway pseudopilin PulG